LRRIFTNVQKMSRPGRPWPERLRLSGATTALATLLGAAVVAQLPTAPANLRIVPGVDPEWPTAAANYLRTSLSTAVVTTANVVVWYRPIEPYISGSTQLVAAGGRVYVATAKGLIVLDAESGSVVCRFDTELPVSTPTVTGGVV
jgi:outer membrane protein assembly factor BamB